MAPLGREHPLGREATMVLKLADMSLKKNAQPLSRLNPGTQALINNIINESNTANIGSGGGAGNVGKFFNHGYDKDPATNGGARIGRTNISIYYMPSTQAEYNRWETVDYAGYWSGRRRLAVREDNGVWSFYTTSHPREDQRLRTNVYGQFTPIDPTK
jgi:hypothetical protein